MAAVGFSESLTRLNYSRRRRRRSAIPASDLHVGFDVVGLERFLLAALEDPSQRPLSSEAQLEARNLSRRLLDRGVPGCHDELARVAAILSELVHTNHGLAHTTVFQVHSFTGQIYEAQAKFNAAIRSYLNAAWIAKASKETIPREHLALTLHRLGSCYGRTRRYRRAAQILTKVLGMYTELGVPETCGAHVNAQHLSKEYAAYYQPSEGSNSTLECLRTLVPIEEGREDEDFDADNDSESNLPENLKYRSL